MKTALARYFEDGGFPDVQGADRRVCAKVLQGCVDAGLYRGQGQVRKIGKKAGG